MSANCDLLEKIGSDANILVIRFRNVMEGFFFFFVFL